MAIVEFKKDFIRFLKEVGMHKGFSNTYCSFFSNYAPDYFLRNEWTEKPSLDKVINFIYDTLKERDDKLKGVGIDGSNFLNTYIRLTFMKLLSNESTLKFLYPEYEDDYLNYIVLRNFSCTIFHALLVREVFCKHFKIHNSYFNSRLTNFKCIYNSNPQLLEPHKNNLIRIFGHEWEKL